MVNFIPRKTSNLPALDTIFGRYFLKKRIGFYVCFILGNSPPSEFYMPTFRNALSVPSSQADKYEERRELDNLSRELLPAAARLLRSCVRIPPGAWIFVCCECRVLSGRGLCDELITRPEESYRLWCVIVCDIETSRMGAPYIYIYMTLVA